ncbi:MAG: hypothetical protein NC548_63885, partial [Lachnospiraceae bacterium]|nr:hypothetical protein [Lachnospiraceae bacterium]
KVYGMPTFTDATKVEFTQSDEITVETLGITAKDAYKNALEITLSVKSGTQNGGVTMVYTAFVTDIAGNVSTKEYSVKIYGTPAIIYDKDAIKITEDATTKAFVVVSFDLNGATGTSPEAQTITKTSQININ